MQQKSNGNKMDFNKREEIDENINDAENIKESLSNPCTSCGNYKDCPEHLSIVEYMDLYNKYTLLGENPINEYAEFLKSKFRLESYISGINSCINCKNCEGKCTQKLTITDRLSKISKILTNFLVAK